VFFFFMWLAGIPYLFKGTTKNQLKILNDYSSLDPMARKSLPLALGTTKAVAPL